MMEILRLPGLSAYNILSKMPIFDVQVHFKWYILFLNFFKLLKYNNTFTSKLENTEQSYIYFCYILKI